MTTAAKHDTALAAEIDAFLCEHGLERLSPPVRKALARDLAGFMSGYAAVQVEKHARPGPWPPPKRPRLDEGAARRLQQSERKKSA